MDSKKKTKYVDVVKQIEEYEKKYILKPIPCRQCGRNVIAIKYNDPDMIPNFLKRGYLVCSDHAYWDLIFNEDSFAWIPIPYRIGEASGIIKQQANLFIPDRLN